jgi:cell division protein FtsL
MKLSGLIDHRVRGFRVVEVGALLVLLALVLAVYLSKAGAGGERADIDHVQQQIDDEQTRIRLLRAEVANLEQPERLEALSSQYLNLQPIPAKHEVQADALPDLAMLQKAKIEPAATKAAVSAPAATDEH